MARYPYGGLYETLLSIPVLALLALLFLGRGKNGSLALHGGAPSLVGALGFLVVTGILLVASGCGYNSTNNTGMGTQRGTATVIITGTSNGLSHATSVTLTV